LLITAKNFLVIGRIMIDRYMIKMLIY